MRIIIDELIFIVLFSLLAWLVYCFVTDFKFTLIGLLILIVGRVIKTHFFDQQD